MNKRVICALGALLLTVTVAAGGESEIGKDPPRTKIVLVKDGPEPVYDLSGDIDPGAEKLFDDIVRSRPGGMRQRQGGWLVLRSLGGDVAAAVLIGSTARQYKIKTYVPTNTYCLSACAIIWAGGYSRWVAEGGTLGFHRPWHMVDGKVTPTETWTVRAYFKRLKFSEEAISHLLAPPDTFYYLTGEKAAELGIKAHFQD